MVDEGPGSPLVEVTGVRRTHRSRKHEDVLALAGVDLQVRRGEVMGLLGPNGAGKSTLVRILMGLLAPDDGAVRVAGADVLADPAAAGRTAAYLAQEEPALTDLDVLTALTTTARLRGRTRAEAAAEADEVVAELSLTPLLGRPLTKLSGGQRRLALVGTALVGERELLVLDEPTTGLDSAARRAVWAALRRRRDERSTAVLLVTHNVLEAERVLDRVAVLDHGRVIACDTPGGLKASVTGEVRLELVWREEPPADPAVAQLAARAQIDGRRWSLRMPPEQAQQAVAVVTTGRALTALDDFTLATPTLEDVYLGLGGTDGDFERE